MNTQFSFNPHRYDLWKIYNIIKKYYPIGIGRREMKGIYPEYNGIKLIEKEIVKNIHDNVCYKDNWLSFSSKIGEELGITVLDTTYGQAPSFSSSVLVNELKFDTLVHVKKINYSVSLLGDFYQIYGVDETVVKDFEDNKRFPATNSITVSPHEEFAKVFEFVEQKIQSKFPEHRIIPYDFGQMIIRGLEVRYSDDIDCSINEALFNNFLIEKNIPISIRGNRNYGKEVWLKA